MPKKQIQKDSNEFKGFKNLFSPQKEDKSKQKNSIEKEKKTPADASDKNDARRKKLMIVIITSIISILLIVSSAVAAYILYGQNLFDNREPEIKPVVEEEVVEVEEVETNNGLVARRMDGTWVSPGEENKYPIAVMVENLSTVRPQSGLSRSLVVYETLAEAGITRFMAMFAGGQAEEIKPVRSARPYYLEWASEYDALYAHCGGSPEALQMISAFNIKDLNQISGSTRFFWRGPGSAPHNLYTSTNLLELAVRDFGLENEKPEYESWKFKDKPSPEEVVTEGKDLAIDFSSAGYSVEYKYDKENNDYLRYNPAGTPHRDDLTGEQLRTENIIVQIIPPIWDLGEKGRINMDVTGEGKAIVFRDGEAIEGVWKKADRTSRTKFYLDDEEIELNRGKIWVEIVPEDRQVTY